MLRAFPGLMLFVLLAPSFAPTTTVDSHVGHVFGIVLTDDELPLPGTQVRLRSDDSGVQRHAETDVNGYFRFRFFKEGKYSLNFERPGFAYEAREHFSVVSNMVSNYLIFMQLGGIDERIVVTDQLPLIKPRECPERLLRNYEFFKLVRTSDIANATLLMKEGVDLSHGQIALGIAAGKGDDEMLRFLLGAGAKSKESIKTAAGIRL